METSNIIALVAVALITALGTLLGQRFMGKSQETVAEAQVEVDQRKVDQEAFDRFIQQYEKERARLIHQIDQTAGIVEAALRHILQLRRAWPTDTTLPPLPEKLGRYIWYVEDSDESSGGN